ncbi:Putative AAA family ATPase [Sorangium cellulosum So ce56]|uniref:AAA family ATPase n=1 Tax=Sorangium cellulosum (strain So ce56) TaxID=448385 RepID=A9FV89_SORC5|nr:AAA family ATPase [Sorangium cellulosum]CAN92249.1 Putative AAA family ATPase [Sorangium cellulosum So ce56]
MTGEPWIRANQRAFSAALDEVRSLLERHARSPGGAPRPDEAPAPAGEASPAQGSPPALDLVCSAFGLSSFERRVLVLCAGIELCSDFPALCAAAQGNARSTHATFSLALAAFPDAHWNALVSFAPLRRYRLIELDRGAGLTSAPLRIDEWALHWLTGTPSLDERLRDLAQPLIAARDLVPTHRRIAERIARLAEGPAAAAVIQLCGADRATRREIAAGAAALRGGGVVAVRAAYLHAADRDLVASLLEREVLLSSGTILIEIDDDEPPEALRAVAMLADRPALPVVVSSAAPVRAGARPVIRVDAHRPARAEQRALWQAAVGAEDAERSGEIERVVQQFDLGREAIFAAAAYARSDLESGNGDPRLSLWSACRAQIRPRLADLAQHIPTVAGWDDLILPPAQIALLREIGAHVRHRACVLDDWGFGKATRGLGVSALFAGASGTGKTMAAEVLARELEMDLHRVDLSQVVSKYIGETEKNLRRVFDAAEDGATVLLFDEADALFGKRSEVKDSHDRFANIEVSYLLQRMESYRGLAILTTNMMEALDDAFLRRIRFVVQFPMPDAALRRAIWQRAFPPATPTEGLDCGKLARLDVAGGNIRNIAIGAAFLAAERGEPVRMGHVLRSARTEYAKLQRPITEIDLGGLS